MKLTRKSRKKLSLIGIYFLVIIVLFWSLGPIYWVLVSSVSTRLELYSTPYKHWIPNEPTFQNYIDLITTGQKYRGGSSSAGSDLLLAGIRNSLFISIGTAIVVTFLATLAGHVFARLKFKGKSLIFYLILLLMPLPLWVPLISLYFLMANLHLIDSNFGLLLIFIAYSLPLHIWLMTTYIREIPKEIEESAIIDGASQVQSLRFIVFPLSIPGMTSVFLVSFLNTWNSFIFPLVFSNTKKSQPITVVLTQFIGQYEVSWESMSAAAVLVLIPPILLALLFQRYLVRGLSMGAVKG